MLSPGFPHLCFSPSVRVLSELSFINRRQSNGSFVWVASEETLFTIFGVALLLGSRKRFCGLEVRRKVCVEGVCESSFGDFQDSASELLLEAHDNMRS